MGWVLRVCSIGDMVGNCACCASSVCLVRNWVCVSKHFGEVWKAKLLTVKPL